MRRRSVRPEPLVALIAVVVFVVVLAACGGGGGGGPTKVVQNGKIEVGAYDIRFDVKTIKAQPGPLTVTLVEHGSLNHTFKVLGKSFELKVGSGTDRESGTIDLKRGTYKFECLIHPDMEGTVKVGG